MRRQRVSVGFKGGRPEISGRRAQGKSGEERGGDSGSKPHPIPGRFLEGKGAGEAGVRARARALDRAGPCARGRSGATCSGNQSSRGGTEGWFGGEDGPA